MINNLISTDARRSNAWFLRGFGLINALGFTLLLSGVGLICDLTIGKWQFPLACILALIVNYFAAKFLASSNSNPVFIKTSGAIVGSLIALIVFSGAFYDVSFDGQWYHQETVYLLKQGYNPIYQQLSPPADEVMDNETLNWCSGVDKPVSSFFKTRKPPINLKFISLNNYSKGAEVIETAIYATTGRIETGKAVNAILLMASFFLSLSLLYTISSISLRKKWILAVLLAFNPVSVTQLSSFCVDGCMGSLLLCLIVISYMLFTRVNGYSLFLLGVLIAISINIKFTSLLFTAMYCAGFLIVMLIFKRKEIFKPIFLTCLLSGTIGIIFCGFNPYVTNAIQKHDVFYGLNDTRAEIKNLTPPVLTDLNRFQKLFLSLSAHQGWPINKVAIAQIPKLPFALNRDDIRDANDAEQEFSGFGPFFSGALLIAFACLVISLIHFKKAPALKYLAATFLIIVATILVMPDSWWARFVPQLWLLPIIILCTSQMMPYRGKRILNGALAISLGLNVAWALLGVVLNVFTSAHVSYQLQQLRALNKPVTIEYCRYRSFKSNQIRLQEAGIPFIEQDVSGPNIYNVIGSNTRFATPVPLPDLPLSFLLRMSEKVGGRKL